MGLQQGLAAPALAFVALGVVASPPSLPAQTIFNTVNKPGAGQFVYGPLTCKRTPPEAIV